MVSAIITTYKRSPEIVIRALNSILAQTYRDIEIIIVDDSPEDYSERENVKKAVLDKQKANKDMAIRYIAHEKNMGACVARNTGLYASKGEYIAYLDDDDEWLPEKIEKQINVMNNSNAALVCCGSICVNEKEGTSHRRGETLFRGNVFKELLKGNFIGSTSFPLIKKDCLLSIDGFDPLMLAVQDYDVWLRLAERYEMDYVDEPLVIYHDHGDERITTNPKRRISGTTRLCQKFKSFLDADRKLWWERHRELSRQYALNGDYAKAMKNWWQCVCKCPERLKYNSVYLFYIVQIIIRQRKM